MASYIETAKKMMNDAADRKTYEGQTTALLGAIVLMLGTIAQLLDDSTRESGDKT